MIVGNPGLPDALGWHPPMSLEFRQVLKTERFGWAGYAQGMGAKKFVRSQAQVTGEEAHALMERYAKAWPNVPLGRRRTDVSDVANHVATYRGSATHAVADLLGAPLAELECKAVEITVNMRAVSR